MSDFFQSLVDIGERSDDKIDLEVVHDIRVISLQRDTIRTNQDFEDSINLLSLIVVIILDSSRRILINAILYVDTFLLAVRLVFDLLSKFAHEMLSMEDIDIIIHLNVHLHGMNDIELTLGLLKVSSLIGNRALSCQDFGHVVILHVGQGFLRIFGADTEKHVEILCDTKDLSVHCHQLNQSLVGALELLEVCSV